MTSATSHKVRPAARPEGEQTDWPVFVCQQGAFLLDPRAYFPVDPEEAKVEFSAGVELSPHRGRVALPPCRKRDTLLDQPRLGLKLSQAEAENLIADAIGAADVVAATDIGPIGQDKASNQDFALAATIRASHHARTTGYQFAAVADGVTTRTLWPERSARLAVLAAWRTARRHVDAGRDFSHQSFDQFRDSLIGEIGRCLETDRNILLAAGQIPNGWSEDAYRQFKDREELWYNSTLHVVLIGPEAGFVLSCGDGGVVVRKHRNRETKSVVLVRSTDDLSVSGIVSLGPDSMRFRQTRITLSAQTSLDVIVATDGVDRSLRREAANDGEDFDPYGPEFLGSSMSALFKEPQAFKGLVDLRLARIANREIDNVSAVLLHWPPPAEHPIPPAPAYSRAIVAAGEGVADINAKMAAARLPSPPPPASPQVQYVDGATQTTTLVARPAAPASRFTPTPSSPTSKAVRPLASPPPPIRSEPGKVLPPSAPRSGPATRFVPPPPFSKSGPTPRFSSPASFSRSRPAGKSSLPPSADRPRSNIGQRAPGAERHARQSDWHLDMARQELLARAVSRVLMLRDPLSLLRRQDYEMVFEQLLNCIPNVDIGGSYLDPKIAYPIFCKLMFFLLADQYSMPEFNRAARHNGIIERVLDDHLRAPVGYLPRFSTNDIDFSRSGEVVTLVLNILKKADRSDAIKRATETLRQL